MYQVLVLLNEMSKVGAELLLISYHRLGYFLSLLGFAV